MAWIPSGSNVLVDVNGNKGRNRYGRDYFFYIAYKDQNGVKQGTIMPDGFIIECQFFGGSCENTCAQDRSTAVGSTGKVLSEDAMNY